MAVKVKEAEGEVEVAYNKKKTILDIVGNIDEMDNRPYSNDPEISQFLNKRYRDQLPGKEKDLSKLTKEVLAEEAPTAGGTYEGSVYYSNILPKGQGEVPWNKEASIIVENAAQYGAKKSEILKAQRYFVDIGYMHPSEVDGMKGKQLQGMISRWGKNAGVTEEAIKDAIKDIDIFNWGK